MAMFSFNDALGKWLLGSYSVGMVLLVRSAAALCVLLPLIFARDGLRAVLSPPQPRRQGLRVTLTTFEAACFYLAVSYMPLAETVAVLAAAHGAHITTSFLMDAVPPALRRWAAIGAGFAGVMIALNPTSGNLGWPALVAVAGSFAFALCMIVTRQLRGTPDITLVTWQTVAALLLGAMLAPVGWITPGPVDFLLLGTLGIVAMAAHMLTNRSLKLAAASVVVPYQYTLIVWALVFGWFVFGDWPTPAMLLGAALIVAAGLAMLVLERRAGNAAAEAAKERVTIEQH